MDTSPPDTFEPTASQRSAIDELALEWAQRSVARQAVGGVVEVGCGRGRHLDALGPDSIGLERSRRLLEQAAREAGTGSGGAHPLIEAVATHLPFRQGSLPGGLALEAFMRLGSDDVAMALRSLHLSARVDARFLIGVPAFSNRPGDWTVSIWPDLVHLCGWRADDGYVVGDAADDLRATAATNEETAASTLRGGLDLVLVGANPSPTSARTGIPFAHRNNRFWPAMIDSGLAVTDRDPQALLTRGIGMTDFSKRVTARADELSKQEVRDGWARLERVLGWLRPRAVGILGVTLFRIGAGQPKARLGWQAPETGLGDIATYVMPNPSGLNAHTNVADMAAHLRAAAAGPKVG